MADRTIAHLPEDADAVARDRGLDAVRPGGRSKRALDIVLALLLLPMLTPLIAVLWALVRLEGGSGFFGHQRVGRGGRLFCCWKIRTMVPDAEERLADLLRRDPQARAEWQSDRKLRDDPRITPLGRFLRDTSLDELPQIWNVLRGDMSLVGPRPVPSCELELYGGYKWVYLALRPGITGLWQVSGRNDVSYSERVELDARYLSELSIVSDLRILLRTVSAVLGKTGY